MTAPVICPGRLVSMAPEVMGHSKFVFNRARKIIIHFIGGSADVSLFKG